MDSQSSSRWKIFPDDKIATSVIGDSSEEEIWNADSKKLEFGTIRNSSKIKVSTKNLTATSKLFTSEIDNDILILSETFLNDWKKVSKKLKNKYKLSLNPKILKRRYHILTSMINISKGKRFTKEEDEKLLNLAKTIGLKWTEIAKHFVGRSHVSLKNRYFKIKKETSPRTERQDSDKSSDSETQNKIEEPKEDKPPQVILNSEGTNPFLINRLFHGMINFQYLNLICVLNSLNSKTY